MKKKAILALFSLFLIVALMATPIFAKDNQSEGKPFQEIWEAITALQQWVEGFLETDPIFVASPAAGIEIGNISNWNTAYGWGDHSLEGYLTSYTESDPLFTASVASDIITSDIGNWNTAYGWGDHSLEGYLTSYTENDPVFGASAASGIASGNITNWNTAYSWGNHADAGYLTGYTETDPKVGANTQGYIPVWDGSALVKGTMYDDGNVGIGTTSPAGPFDVWTQIRGAETLDQQQTAYNYGGGGYDDWQSFTPGITGYLTKLTLFISSPVNGQDRDVTIRIHMGQGTGGTVLATQTIRVPAGGLQWCTCTFLNPPFLTSGQKYTFRMTTPVVNIMWQCWQTTNPYPGGRYSYNSNWDCVFKTYMVPVSLESVLMVSDDGNIGIGTTTPQGKLDIDSTTGALIVPRMTTTQRNALTAVNGMIIYNTSTNQFNFYENGAWVTK